MLGEGRFAVVLHADEGDAVTAVVQDDVAIVQQLPAHSLLLIPQVLQVVGLLAAVLPVVVGAVVVIAQNRVNTVRGSDGVSSATAYLCIL